ncbi:hypothetical protein [Herbiconiux ginsengi]|uniref:Lipoprotein n=1 Tax=Herbiconiux ginsengi TaxID=381665 RepID=A0A1H3QTN9_9MICO|nr:hypothetical protein [Herbiconiux ginsengi]SDZ16421.1 hypothetical protein SAMN05216554_2721 [Herbiconiux ginsengi]
MSRRSFDSAAGRLGCVVVLASALAGCTAGPAATVAERATETPAPSSSSSLDSSSDALHYPSGASADTPECQDASSAVLAAVNATIDNPLPGGSNTVPSLTATPDPEHAVWLLIGAIPSTGTAGGFVVAWATTGDPTRETFEGNLRSVGSPTATVSSAPALQFADVGAPGAFLAAAASTCAAGMPSDTRG